MELKVVNKNENLYELINNKGEKFLLNLRFFGLERDLDVNDYIFIHDELLDKNYVEYSKNYIFGPLDEPYGRDVKDETHLDCVVLKQDDKLIYLKRFFG